MTKRIVKITMALLQCTTFTLVQCVHVCNCDIHNCACTTDSYPSYNVDGLPEG